ncbi:MAG: cupin domain-containing protein [Bacteroidia bacterium]|nr:cupin domain-containing protein [Bacteroidia bacterium]
MDIHPDVAALLAQYQFEQLPVEGTLFRSTYRSAAATATGGPAGTAMIGMYCEVPLSISCFHRLTHDEVWHFYGGDPLVLYLLHPDGRSESIVLGPDPLAGHLVQAVVPAHTWQGGCLKPGGRYALFGCTMGPGFTGECFEAGLASDLTDQYPDQADIIRQLSLNGDTVRMPDGFAG